MKAQPPIPNEVSDETGQFDFRFQLWRKFCAEQGIPVEYMPSTLSPELQRAWKKFKETPGDEAAQQTVNGKA
jgi:hypothetical protein